MSNFIANYSSESQAGTVKVKHMSFIKRVLGVIFSPGAVMESLRAKPRVLFPVILMIVASLAFLAVNFDMYREYLTENLMNVYDTMNMEMTEEQLESFAKVSAVISLVTMPVGILAVWLAGTAILFGIIKIFKGEGTFKQFLSVTGYAYVIMVLSYIVTSIIAYFTGIFNMELNATSLASLFSTDMRGTFIYGVLNAIELFSIWYYIVIGIGVAIVSKLTKKKTYLIIGVLYALLLAYNGFQQVLANIYNIYG